MPSTSLMASVAWIVPTSPGSTPSTPASAQLGASSDSELVDLALQKLETNYYRPIDPQTPIAGERKALIGILQHAVPDATLPQETATGTQSDDAVLAEKLLAVSGKDRAGKAVRIERPRKKR